MVAIKDSVFVVTGGSSGLGKSTVELFLSEGAHVTIIDLTTPSEAYFDRFGDRALFIKGDVSSESAIQKAFEATKQKFGKINGLVHCAGIFKMGDEIFNMTTQKPGDWKVLTDILNVNLFGTLNVNRLVIPFLLENDGDKEGQRGLIVNTSSVSGYDPMPSALFYSISKAGIIALTFPLAKQLSSVGIRVMDIAPALCDTPMFASALEFNDDIAALQNAFPRRPVRPSEFASTIKYIIENPMLNGSSIKLDGALRP